MPATAEQCRAYRQRLKRRALCIIGGPGLSWCRRCWATDRLEFAHVRCTGLNGPSRGLTRRMLDVLRNPESYVILCNKCHLRFDGKQSRALITTEEAKQ